MKCIYASCEIERACIRAVHWLLVWGAAFHITVSAAPPPNDSPPNDPKAIVEALIGRDYKGGPRYTGGQESFEYKPIFESYPAYEVERLVSPSGQPFTRENPPTFGRCAQQMIVKDIKVTNVQYAQDPSSRISSPSINTSEAYVTVEADVVALRLYKLNEIPPQQRCSWLGLEVKNTQTGKREAYFDNLDDDQLLLKMMKQFGTLDDSYVVVDPHRRRWSYGITLILPKSGRGQKRHYDSATRKYIDSTEPRWLIQEPYSPPAFHLGAAIKRLSDQRKHAIEQAEGRCRNAIEQQTGKKMARPIWSHPACGVGSGAADSLGSASYFEAMLKVLQKMTLGEDR